MSTAQAIQPKINQNQDDTKYPKQIKYIVWNEACERYSYYGMRSILVIFLVQYFALTKSVAVSDYHLFAGACYLTPLLGAYISDRFFGKYKTILWLSIVYCIGHAFLAVFEESRTGFYWGLFLIALGSGGIKPCVSAHVGDQFKPTQKALLKKVFDLFYWMINFGSFFSSMLTPITLEMFGPGVAFGIPGVLMVIATFIFWKGRDHFVHIPPTGKDPDSFGVVVLNASLRHFWIKANVRPIAENSPLIFFFMTFILTPPLMVLAFLKYIIVNTLTFNFKESFASIAKDVHESDKIEAVDAVFNVAKIFAGVSVFWALFDQHGSTWVLQAKEMELGVSFFGFNFELLPAQIPAMNPIMVMCLIPIFTFGIYPFIENKLGYKMTPLRRMGFGMLVAAISFVFVALFQYNIDAGNKMNVLWQVIPYLVITMAEVMVSITGLEFAYTQAPRSMKSTIMSLWLLTVFFGNMITASVSSINPFEGGGHEFMFYAALMGAFTLLFGIIAKFFYTEKDYMEN